jgi:hypothetical protein
LFTSNQVQLFTNPNRFFFSPSQSHEELWLDCAQKLTAVIQQIIEFAKLIPVFMRLSQEDQIVLLKSGTVLPVLQLFSLLAIRHSTAYSSVISSNQYFGYFCLSSPCSEMEIRIVHLATAHRGGGPFAGTVTQGK